MAERPAPSGAPGGGTDSSDETGLADAVRERLVRRLAADLGAAWNRALAAGADPRRLIGRVEAARRHIRSAPAGRTPTERPPSDPGHTDRELSG